MYNCHVQLPTANRKLPTEKSGLSIFRGRDKRKNNKKEKVFLPEDAGKRGATL